jgi:hypothetical protein
MNAKDDKRPEPKPRKHPRLWQAYLWWDELMQMRKRHLLRLSSIEHEKSNMDAQFELSMMEAMRLDALVDPGNKAERAFSPETVLMLEGEQLGDVWKWITSIRGMKAGGLAAQVLAQIDDPGKFATISKLWRFSGYAVIDGEIEHRQKGEKAPFNARLKSIVYLVVDQFIKQQTPVYSDLYYAEKERQRVLHPEPICKECGGACKSKKNGDGHTVYRCIECGGMANFTDAHIHNRAIRKVARVFLQHLWLVWRESEGLPVSKPWIIEHGGHADYIVPPGWPLS